MRRSGRDADEQLAALARARVALLARPELADDAERPAGWVPDGAEPEVRPARTQGSTGRLALARRVRLGLERRHVALLALVLVLGVAGAAVVVLLSRPGTIEAEPVVTRLEPTAASSGALTAEAPGSTAAEDVIVVHVAGLVATPGIVELPVGSRIVDAIEAAGGAAAESDLTGLNLARILMDGEQVVVTAHPAGPTGGVVGEPSGASSSSRVSLNSASAADLESLPGIGPALAGRILQWRQDNGGFRSVDELREVTGIGDRRFTDLEPLVTL